MLNADKQFYNSTRANIKTTKLVYPQIYSYTLPGLKDHDGSQKIGYTERQDVDKRIHEQTHTAAIKLKPQKQWSAPAFFKSPVNNFNDKDFHKFLKKSNIENKTNLGKEWFYFNGHPEQSKQLFDSFREQGFVAIQTNSGKIPYNLRTEQQLAVDQAIEYFNKHENGEFLWNAKPRFGKTLATYDLAKKIDAKKVLIVTNRPAIANSWFDDFNLFIDGYKFISETSSLDNKSTLTRHQFISAGIENPQITFLSLQDLKGSKYFGGNHDKLKWIADLNWDLLVIDEAHEGIDTSRTDAAFNVIKRKNTLHLSGTPFKALANNKFHKDAIFNWTYLDEQKIKKAELEEDEIGDHTDLPNLKLFTYRISQMISDEINEGLEIDNENRDFAFDLNEFFATKNQKFIHEDDVKQFLVNLSTNSKYPFSTPELRNELRHTFWYVGNRVDSVKALEQLLKQDAVFKYYKVIVAAGDGKSFDEEETDFEGNEKSFDKVQKAIKTNDKTITLSCGQLTTGVTVKEWSAVLMLTDIKTPAQYMQAAFRAQNPHRFSEGNQLKAKQSAYLFDFAPTRVLEIYEKFANGLNGEAVNGEITETERKANIKELLNYFPVISEDTQGQMVELDAEMVLTFPNALAATEIVKARFMTNLLFNDNIKNVFHFPKEIEEILDKMPVEKNKRPEVSKKELDLSDARKLEQNKQKKINENTGVMLGDKIYRANIERVVDNALSYETPQETLETLPAQVSAIAEPLIAIYKQTYKVTNTEIEEISKDTKEKIKIVVAEYENAKIKEPQTLKENLTKVIEHDLVTKNVEKQETAKVEEVKKSKEEEVREHLRAFTRTIPMFVMANSLRGNITIDNFDKQVSNTDFVDLTNITKEEFHKLRDGFEYTDDKGERQHFGGVFDRYKFNASISEFVAEKQKRADYFNTDEDIFELIPNQKNNQIFTPRKVVKLMIDGLEKEQPELFCRTDSTFIDLYMKSGMYITEIVKKLFAGTRHNYSSDKQCLKHILENQVYGLAPTGVLYGITTSYIFGFDVEHNISSKSFVQHDLLPEAKAGTVPQKLAQLFGNGGNMIKFDAVVGNPPYQENIENRGEQPPLYHHFIKQSQTIANSAILITPARFLFNVGLTPKAFNKEMLNNEHFKILHYERNATSLFPDTEIKGGVVISIFDNKNSFGKMGVFTSYQELNPLIKKVQNLNFEPLSNILFGNTSYKYSKILFDENPAYNNRLTGGSKRYLASSVFDVLSEVFFDSKPEDNNSYIKIYGREKGQRKYKYIKRKYFKEHGNLEYYKVFLPSSNGSGEFGETLSAPEIGLPYTGHTETYVSFGAFEEIIAAENLIKYLNSKFLRAMLGTVKITQGNKTKEVWKNVPLQDFTQHSDID